MSKATEILDKHVIEFQEEFLNTNKMKRLKDKILEAMEEYKHARDITDTRCEEGQNNDCSCVDTCGIFNRKI